MRLALQKFRTIGALDLQIVLDYGKRKNVTSLKSRDTVYLEQQAVLVDSGYAVRLNCYRLTKAFVR